MIFSLKLIYWYLLAKLYESLSFKEIHTDLYNFLQTNELNKEIKLKNFKAELDKVFKPLITEKDTFYNIFASNYRKGDYLLCHDDMVDKRLYAFTFYLEDFNSGNLVLYEHDCKTVHKSISIKRNRLVVFEVEDYSYHEVEMCYENGRKAFTGWINSNNKINKAKKIANGLSVDENIEYFDIGIDIENEDFVILEFKDIASPEISRNIMGPFIDRRCTEIKVPILYVPEFKDYKLVHTEFINIDSSGYILCNDKINSLAGDVLDVFIFNCDGVLSDYINYVGENSEISFTIDAMDQHMIIGKRHNHNICIRRTPTNINFKHFMYIKAEKC